MSDPYKEKYFKYKQKYLELKKELEQKGGLRTNELEMEISLANLNQLERGDVFRVLPGNIDLDFHHKFIVFKNRDSMGLYFRVYNMSNYVNGTGGYDSVIPLSKLPFKVVYIAREENKAGPVLGSTSGVPTSGSTSVIPTSGSTSGSTSGVPTSGSTSIFSGFF